MQSAYLILSHCRRFAYKTFVARAAVSTYLRNICVFSNGGWFRRSFVLGVPFFVVWIHPYLKKAYLKEHNKDVKVCTL